MLSKALDYVMLSHLLTKLDLESYEQLARARPALANIYSEIEASSYDPESESATGVPKLLMNVPAEKQLDTLQGHGERSRSQLLFKLACRGNMRILAVNALAVNTLAVNGALLL